jgi:Domain of unknown function (DUF4157)
VPIVLPETGKRCACGGTIEGGGECAACRARRSLPIASPSDERERAADAAVERALGGVSGRGAMRPPAAPTADPLGASSGRLPRAVARDLGSRFGHDFSQIKVFSDEASARAADTLGAAAFTVGQNVYFAHGRYQPDTPEGRTLIAHELAHTIQQASGPALIQRRLAGDCASAMENVDEQRDELSRAGRAAHLQIESYFSDVLSHERRVPRGDKRTMGRACPGVTTSYGAADLVRFKGMTVSIGEIKSIDGREYAAPEVAHYIERGDESAGRLLGTGPCRGRPDDRDKTFDEHWFEGAIQRTRRKPTLQALDTGVPAATTDLGPFLSDARKHLRCERRAGGAVVYWCVPRDPRRRRDSRQSQTAAMPAARPQAQPQQMPRARIVDVATGFEDTARRMRPVTLPAGRDLIIAFDAGMYDQAARAAERAYLERQRRFMRVDLRSAPAITTMVAGAVVGGVIAAPAVIMLCAEAAPEVITSLAAFARMAIAASETATGSVAASQLGAGSIGAGEVATGAAAAGGAGAAAAGGAGTAVASGAATTYATSTGITLTVLQGGAGAAAGTVATGGVASISAGQAAAAAAAIALMTGISRADAATGLRPYLDRPLAAVVDVTDHGLGAHQPGSTISLGGGAFRVAITLTTRDQP